MDKANKNILKNSDTKELFSAILSLKNIDGISRFFRDLLTKKEIEEFGKRWKVAQMLDKRVSYVKIEEETGMSSTTIARVHKWLKNGMSGYKLALRRLKEKG